MLTNPDGPYIMIQPKPRMSEEMKNGHCMAADRTPPPGSLVLTTTMAIGTASSLLLMKGFARGMVGMLMSVSGLYFLARATTNLPPRRLLKATARKALQIQDVWPTSN